MKKKRLVTLVLFLLTISSAVLLLLIRDFYKDSFKEDLVDPLENLPIEIHIDDNDKDDVVVDDGKDDEKTPVFNTYDDYKAANKDYVGLLKFDSGLIELPVFQSTNNDYYMRLNWLTGEYAAEGSTFLDYRNLLEDQNLIIYGHYVYSTYDSSMSLAFTPLGKLADYNNYVSNSTLKFILKDETREYQVAYVYYCELDEGSEYHSTAPDMQYYRTFYSDDYFDVYMDAVEAAKFYDTGVTLSNDDNFITLLTCVENHEELRMVVICKEVAVYPN